MKVYFYHTQDIQMILGKLRTGEFPPHFLYGATKLHDYGIDVIWHKSRLGLPRWKMMLRNAWIILSSKEKYDALYATHYRGIEIIIFLRALRLFHKPVIVWHHQPIITPRNPLRELLGRLFYKGFDRMFFFSKKLIDDSLKSKKARAERMRLGHWGMDIPLWAEEKSSANSPEPVFISSGKEMRDMETLVKAFNATGARLDIYINERNGNIDYGGILRNLNMGENINVYFQIRLAPYEISRKVALSDCVCICCQPTKYTVGLTTLVEALSLGKPIICSRNPQFPFSVDHEGCGISVAYHDVEGWTNAVNYIKNHPEEAKNMGRKAKRLALTRYNDSICAQEAARAIIETANKKKRACNN